MVDVRMMFVIVFLSQVILVQSVDTKSLCFAKPVVKDFWILYCKGKDPEIKKIMFSSCLISWLVDFCVRRHLGKVSKIFFPSNSSTIDPTKKLCKAI